MGTPKINLCFFSLSLSRSRWESLSLQKMTFSWRNVGRFARRTIFRFSCAMNFTSALNNSHGRNLISIFFGNSENFRNIDLVLVSVKNLCMAWFMMVKFIMHACIKGILISMNPPLILTSIFLIGDLLYQAANLWRFRASMNSRCEGGILDFMDGIPDFMDNFKIL